MTKTWIYRTLYYVMGGVAILAAATTIPEWHAWSTDANCQTRGMWDLPGTTRIWIPLGLAAVAAAIAAVLEGIVNRRTAQEQR